MNEKIWLKLEQLKKIIKFVERINNKDMEELIKILKLQPKEWLQFIILELMISECVSYEDITKVYVEYLDMLRKGQSEAYQELQYRVVDMWSGTKKDRDQKLKDTMHYLLDKGRINTTHEEIDKHK